MTTEEIRAYALGYEPTYAEARAAESDAQARQPIPGPSDADLIAFVAAHAGLTLTQLAAGLNTMGSRALSLQLRRLGKPTGRRPARLACVGGKWYVGEGE
jgi:hypothetical protein